jgi:Fur family ferric uptake transcriptional regulator
MSHDMAAITAQLHQGGYRVTPQRQLILDAICRLGGHVTPEQVYDHVRAITPSLNRATVYRTLNFLADQRIITVAAVPGGQQRYALPGPDPHHHLVCRQCQATLEVPDHEMHHVFRQIQKRYGFVIDMGHISFLGQCAHCQTSEGESR